MYLCKTFYEAAFGRIFRFDRNVVRLRGNFSSKFIDGRQLRERCYEALVVFVGRMCLIGTPPKKVLSAIRYFLLGMCFGDPPRGA